MLARGSQYFRWWQGVIWCAVCLCCAICVLGCSGNCLGLWLCLHGLLCWVLRISVVLGCGDAAGRALAGVWRSSGGGIGFGTWCFATVCVSVDTCRHNLLWRAHRQWRVAAVCRVLVQCLGSICGNGVVCGGSI
eukprot:11473892-Ditylum_brightwellii.AAC.1